MPLRKVIPLRNIKIEEIDEFHEESNEDKNNFTQKYFFMIEGYSKSSNIGFVKIEISGGNSVYEAYFSACDKIRTNLFVNYNISIDEMMASKWRLLETSEVIQSSGCGFYTLADENGTNIERFREDEERYLMSCEDK